MVRDTKTTWVFARRTHRPQLFSRLRVMIQTQVSEGRRHAGRNPEETSLSFQNPLPESHGMRSSPPAARDDTCGVLSTREVPQRLRARAFTGGLVPQGPLAGTSRTPDPQEERGVSTQVRHREPLLSVRVLRTLPTPRFAMPAQGQLSRRHLPAQPGLPCELLRTKPFKDHFKKNTVSDYVVKIQTRIENVFLKSVCF